MYAGSLPLFLFRELADGSKGGVTGVHHDAFFSGARKSKPLAFCLDGRVSQGFGGLFWGLRVEGPRQDDRSCHEGRCHAELWPG